MVFLFILSGCQIFSNEKGTVMTSNDTVEKAAKISETSEKNSQSTKSETSQSEEDKSMSYDSGSLLKAVSSNDSEKVAEILETKTYPIDELNEKGETPLLIAVHNNQIELAKKLIDAGAKNIQDNIADSPYLYAGAEGRTEILAYMLSHSEPDQSIVNRFGGNALIPAAEKGHLETVKLLLTDGHVTINHQNNYGYTALIEAVALRDGSKVYQDIVSELLKYGANPDITDNYGKSAKDYANELGYGTISKLLKE